MSAGIDAVVVASRLMRLESRLFAARWSDVSMRCALVQ